MSTGALENKSQQKSGRAIALPAPPPPRSLSTRFAAMLQDKSGQVKCFSCPFLCTLNYCAELLWKPSRVGSISGSLPTCIEEHSSKLISGRSNNVPLFLLGFSVELQESAHSFPAQRAVIEPTRRTAAVLSQRVVYPCSRHERNCKRSDRNRAPLLLRSIWQRKLWRMLWD